MSACPSVRLPRPGTVAGTVLCVAAGLLSAPWAEAATSQLPKPAFSTPYLCSQAGRYTPAQCKTAFANAQAEWDESAPRFPTREACMRYFKRCVIGKPAPGSRVSFMPGFDGVQIQAAPTGSMVVPVFSPSGIRPAARPRPLDVLKTDRNPQRQRQAQAAWQAQVNAYNAAPAAYEGNPAAFTPEKPEAYDPDWQKQKGVPMYPGPRAKRPQPAGQ
ncbi:MAG: DUF1190 domain-containing protein [Alsobacter sp.]